MKRLFMEIHTYGTENLARVGAYRYSEHQDTELLLLGYAVDDEPIQIVDVAHGEKIPHQIISALSDSHVVKIAYSRKSAVSVQIKEFYSRSQRSHPCQPI